MRATGFVAGNGSFVVTLDPQPAGGRVNHIQTRLEARYRFIREARSDWRQNSIAFRIRRLDTPSAPPLTIEQMAERAAPQRKQQLAARMELFERRYVYR